MRSRGYREELGCGVTSLPCGRAGRDPGADDLALPIGDLRNVARRHRTGAHGIDLDQVSMALNVFEAVEQDVLGRGGYPRPDRRTHVAHAAAGQNNVMRFSNIDALRLCDDRALALSWAGAGEPRHRDHARTRNAPGPPWAALSFVARIEEVPDHRADREHNGNDEPVEAGGEDQ